MQKVVFKEKAVTVCSVHDKEGVFSKHRMKLSATSSPDLFLGTGSKNELKILNEVIESEHK